MDLLLWIQLFYGFLQSCLNTDNSFANTSFFEPFFTRYIDRFLSWTKSFLPLSVKVSVLEYSNHSREPSGLQ